MIKFNKTDKTILILAICSFVFFIYLFNSSLLFLDFKANEQLESIGTITELNNDVRRKVTHNFVWLPSNNQDTIFQSDSIFTGADSAASIQLYDGSIIKISPHSLVKMNFKDGEMNLDLKYGILEGAIKETSKINIKSEKEFIRLESKKSKISLNKNYGQKININLISGAAKIKTKDAVKELTVNQPVTFNQKIIKEIIKPVLSNLRPENTTFIKVNPTTSIKFDWNSQPKASKYLVEVSKDSLFQEIFKTYFATTTSIDTNDIVEVGPVYWRVSALNFDGTPLQISTTASFKISTLPAPIINTPTHLSKIYNELPFNSPHTSFELPIKWTKNYPYSAFNIQVSKDKDYKEILIDAKTNNLFYKTPKLSTGNYWIRVQGVTRQNQSSWWSDSIEIDWVVNRKKETAPSAPYLLTDAIHYKTNTEQLRNPSSVRGPLLQWRSESPVKSYQLQMSKDKLFKNIKTVEIESDKYLWSQFETGKTYFKVSSIGKNNLKSPPSKMGEVNVSVLEQLTPPLLFEPQNNISIFTQSAHNPSIMFSWKKTDNANQYRIEISNAPDFKEILVTDSSSLNRYFLKTSLPHFKKIYWRVLAIDTNSQMSSSWSKPREFKILNQNEDYFVK